MASTRLTYMQHQKRLRYWRDYYRRNKSHIFRGRPGRVRLTNIVAKSFREATPAAGRLIQGRHRTVNSKSEITKLRLSISAKRRAISTKETASELLGTRRSAQLRRGSRKRKGI